jgi:histidinol-phosphatase
VDVVVTEAGGRFSDWHGRDSIESGDGIATNGLVHDAALGVIRGAVGS